MCSLLPIMKHSTIKLLLVCIPFQLLGNSCVAQITTVQPKNKIISIAGHYGGRIGITKIKAVNSLEILPSYKLLSAVVYFSGDIGTGCTTAASITSEKFSKEFKKYWARLGPGSNVAFDNIKVLKPNGEVGVLVATSFAVY